MLHNTAALLSAPLQLDALLSIQCPLHLFTLTFTCFFIIETFTRHLMKVCGVHQQGIRWKIVKNCEIIISVSLGSRCLCVTILAAGPDSASNERLSPAHSPLHSPPPLRTGEKREIVRRRGVIFTFSRDQVRCWLQNIIPEWTLAIVSCHGTVSMWAVDPGLDPGHQWSQMWNGFGESTRPAAL